MNWVQQGQRVNPRTGKVETMMNLQATLSAGSAETGLPPTLPHHPITCSGSIALEEDGVLSCDHSKTVARDTRTQHCVNSSIAMLLIELAADL